MSDKTDRIKAECLGIRCFDEMESNEKSPYTLIPITEWTDEICKELNKTDFSKNYKLDDNDQLDESDVNCKEKFSKLNKSVEKVYICNDLPISYVRFHNTVIINNTDEIDKKVLEIEASIIKKLGIVARFDSIKLSLMEKTTPITSENCNEYKDDLNNLKKICALSAKHSINKRPVSGADNQVWYELLQNANDHIPNASSGKELKITFNASEKTFTLEYPDEGFSVRDFLAICTEGNSGNVLSDKNREGRKGTGFKSVYNLFDKVTITSGPIECVLEDVEKTITILENDIKVLSMENAKQSENYYPIPEFKMIENGQAGITKIIFHSKDNNLDSIKKLVFGENTSEDILERFRSKKDYLFLDNIEKIKFFGCSSENSIEFNRNMYIQDNYFKKEYVLDNSSDDSFIKKDKNPNWKNRPEDLFDKKKSLNFLFPKNIDFSKDVEESRVYCTLPIDDFKLKIPFFVNIPLLELKDDRKSLADHEIDGFSFKVWNQSVLKSGLMNGFKNVVEDDMSSEYQENIGISNWYKYFPYEYLNQNNEVFSNNGWEGLKEVRFLRTTTNTKVGGENVKPAAITDLVQREDDLANNEKSIFLPCNMYWWLHQNKDDIFPSKDIFSSKESTDSVTLPPISFVYYENNNLDDNKLQIEDTVREKIESKILPNNDFKFNYYSVRYLRKKEADEGKPLLEIKEYLLNNYKKNLQDKSLLYQWLKNLLKSDSDFNFAYKNTFIYQAYFNADGVDYEKGKFHWLKKEENSFYEDSYKNCYDSINSKVQDIKRDLYDIENDILHTEENNSIIACFDDLHTEENNSIIACFDDLVLSPYIKYTYEKKNGGWNIPFELRGKEDTVLPKQSDTEVDDFKELYCYYTKELLDKVTELKIGKVKDEDGWFKKNNVALYVKNTNGNIIQASEQVYYTDKEIKSDLLVNYGECFFVNFTASLKKDGDFFKKNKENEEFVKQILENYDLNVWKEQAINFVKSSKDSSDAAIRLTILRYVIDKETKPIEWNDEFSDLIKDFSTAQLWKNGQVIFELSKDRVDKLSQYVLDIFENKVSIQEKEKTKIDAWDLGKSLQEIVKNDIFVLSCKTGNKSLYCKGKIFEENNTTRDIYVLFGENAFGTLLRNVFKCYDFSENKIYDEMLCIDVDALNGFQEQESKDFVDSINNKVDDLLKKWKMGGKEELKRALVTRFDVKNSNKWFHARGYGNEEYKSRMCPVCKGILLSEMNALTVRNITCTIKDQKYYFPMLICKNCGEAINYAETVELEISNDVENNENLFKVAKNSVEEYNVVFSMNGREKKKMNCEVTFLNRYIWKRIKEKEDESRQEKI